MSTFTFDPTVNGAYGRVAVAPTPGKTGMSLTLEAGQGARFPATGAFTVRLWPEGQVAEPGTVEFARVSSRSGDELTFSERNTSKESGSTSLTVVVGYQVAMDITAYLIEQMRTAINALTSTVAESGVAYVSVTGSDVTGDGSCWAKAVKSLAKAQELLPEATEQKNPAGQPASRNEVLGQKAVNGKIIMGYTPNGEPFKLTSTQRVDTCTFTGGSEVATDASIKAGDLGAFLVAANAAKAEGRYIVAVTPGVGFTMNSTFGSGTEEIIITQPGFVKQPGVILEGLGQQNGRHGGESTNFPTLIQEEGRGTTIMEESGKGEGSNESYARFTMRGFTIKGKTTPGAENIYGYAVANDQGSNITEVTFLECGWTGCRVMQKAGVTAGEMSLCEYRRCGALYQTYSGAVKYALGEAVVEGGKAYKCIKSGTGHTPSTEPTWWEVMDAQSQLTSTVETTGCTVAQSPNVYLLRSCRADHCNGNGIVTYGCELINCIGSATEKTAVAGTGYGLWNGGSVGNGTGSIRGGWCQSNATGDIYNTGTLDVQGIKLRGGGTSEYGIYHHGSNTLTVRAVASWAHGKKAMIYMDNEAAQIKAEGCKTITGGEADTIGVERTTAALTVPFEAVEGEYRVNMRYSTSPLAATKLSSATLTGTWHNTTGGDVRLSIPVTFEAGATVEVKIGSTSPGTSPGVIERALAAKDVINVYVPAQWYCTVVLSSGAGKVATINAEATAQPA